MAPCYPRPWRRTRWSEYTVGVVPPNPVNSPPVAVDDVRQVPQGGLLDIDPVANDSDPDGDALSLDQRAASHDERWSDHAPVTVVFDR